ncbi:unnamed protein product, partial [Polarella glacialis]
AAQRRVAEGKSGGGNAPPFGISPEGGAAKRAPAPQQYAERVAPVQSSSAAEGQDPATEKDLLIQQCLDQGLSDEEIYEVLEQFQNQKFLEEIDAKNGRPQAMPLRELSSQPQSAERDIDSMSLASKRERASKTSDASVASHDPEKSRQAYLASQKQAADARTKNRYWGCAADRFAFYGWGSNRQCVVRGSGPLPAEQHHDVQRLASGLQAQRPADALHRLQPQSRKLLG